MVDSFSQKIKKELCNIELTSQQQRKLVLAVVFANIGIFRGNTVQISTGFQPLGEIIKNQFYALWAQSPFTEKRGEITKIKLDGEQYVSFKQFLAETIGFFPFPLKVLMDLESLDSDERRLILRYFFLSFGSICDPYKAYHLELSFRRGPIADMAFNLLQMEGIKCKVVKRSHFYRICIKDSQLITDFLAMIGAHVGLLTLENLRLEKDLRNNVNRAVNCDSANSKRVAATSVRQVAAVNKIISMHKWELLPENLQEIAELRLQNPELSLAELGELLNPALGKSGVNHRLDKIEKIARQL